MKYTKTLVLLLLLLPFGVAFAEVPFHNPDLDYKCQPGFQWSRDTVACEQAECPASLIGRTYTLECKCPAETVGEYKDGLLTGCVPEEEVIPFEGACLGDNRTLNQGGDRCVCKEG